MNRRELIGTLGVTAATLAAFPALAQDAKKEERDEKKDDRKEEKGLKKEEKEEKKKDARKDQHVGHGVDDHVSKCAQACSDCQRECNFCATHCADMLAEGNKDHYKTLHTCHDCADVCAAAAQIVARRGVFADLICGAAAEACARCAKACEEFKDDEHMQKCARECLECEKACREMVETIGHHHDTAGKEAEPKKQ